MTINFENMEKDIKDFVVKSTLPMLYSSGWQEGTSSIYRDSEGGVSEVVTTYTNKINDPEFVGRRDVYIYKKNRNISMNSPVSYEELQWFAKVALAGGFDEEDEW